MGRAYRNLVEKSEGTRPLRRTRHRWEDNVRRSPGKNQSPTFFDTYYKEQTRKRCVQHFFASAWRFVLSFYLATIRDHAYAYRHKRSINLLLLRVFVEAGTFFRGCCLAAKEGSILKRISLAKIWGINIQIHGLKGVIFEVGRSDILSAMIFYI
jgi:hypothetical protein